MWAGTVAAPGAAISAGAWSTIARSMSVAVRATRSPLASTSTLLRIGMVLRRSTTLCTWPRDFSNAVRSIVSFMVFATPSQVFGDRFADGWNRGSGRSGRCYFSLLECPEKPGRSARIIGPFQQVRDYIRMGGKQQPKARQLAARQGQLAVPAGPVSCLFEALPEPIPRGSAAGLDAGLPTACRPLPL